MLSTTWDAFERVVRTAKILKAEKKSFYHDLKHAKTVNSYLVDAYEFEELPVTFWVRPFYNSDGQLTVLAFDMRHTAIELQPESCKRSGVTMSTEVRYEKDQTCTLNIFDFRGISTNLIVENYKMERALLEAIKNYCHKFNGANDMRFNKIQYTSSKQNKYYEKLKNIFEFSGFTVLQEDEKVYMTLLLKSDENQ